MKTTWGLTKYPDSYFFDDKYIFYFFVCISVQKLILGKPVNRFSSEDSGKNCWILLKLENVFPLQGIHLTFDHRHRPPTFYVSYIISKIIIYSYSYRSRTMLSQYYFGKFVPIVFPCVDYPFTFYLSTEDGVDSRHNNSISRIAVNWRWCWQSPQ